MRDDAGRGGDADQGTLFVVDEPDRAVPEARWLMLTRTVLPAMAAHHGWPIRLDHCFMRVCLDAALGAPWTATVKSPTLRHMTAAQLDAALRVAEDIAARPGLLPGLNRASLAGRRAARSGQTRPAR